MRCRVIELSSVIGIVLGFTALIGGLILKGGSPSILVSPAALVIIFLGTAACLLIAFPMREIKKFFILLKLIFSDTKMVSERDLLPKFVDWAKLVRKEGIVALEKELSAVDNAFLKKGIELVLEGQDSKDIEEMLEEDLASTEERHLGCALIFTQAGTYAPTLGVLGAVMGLIGALGHLNDIEKLGHSIAAAFVATMFGIFTGYVMWHPMANKLKRKSKREIDLGHFIIKGIVCLQEDASPIIMERKLTPYLPSKQRNFKAAKPKEEANVQT